MKLKIMGNPKTLSCKNNFIVLVDYHNRGEFFLKLFYKYTQLLRCIVGIKLFFKK
jgi:hypothetical protein